MTIIYFIIGLIVIVILFRFVGLEFINKNNHTRMVEAYKAQAEMISDSEKVYIMTQARLIITFFSLPVVITLQKGYIEYFHSIPRLKPVIIKFRSVKDMGMDTFLPSGTPLNTGRVIRILLKGKSGKKIFFVIKEDIEPWRAWIQSFGFRA